MLAFFYEFKNVEIKMVFMGKDRRSLPSYLNFILICKEIEIFAINTVSIHFQYFNRFCFIGKCCYRETYVVHSVTYILSLKNGE